MSITGCSRPNWTRTGPSALGSKNNRAKDQFLARVSHELRSPLQVALSTAELLKPRPEEPAQGPGAGYSR